MRRAMIAIALFFGIASQTAAAASDDMARAMDAMRRGDWDGARATARGAGGLGQDIIEWHRLRAGRGSFAEAQAFLARRADWPGLPYLREKSEDSIPETANPQEVIAFFEGSVPQTGTGALRLARAFEAAGRAGEAEAVILLAWRSLQLSASLEVTFLSRYKALLEPHHVARLDMLLWEGHETAAGRMLPLVPDGWQKLAAARIALSEDQPGVDTRIEAVPSSLANDPGLAYERFAWRIRKGLMESAVALLDERSSSLESLGQPGRWSNRRRSMARDAMREGRHRDAYRLASRHWLTSGSDYADLEWLSGYLALTFLNDPTQALTHFRRFRAAVETPISLGRAGYWEGRAHEALGATEAARAAYAFGADYQTSFYGLLAAERAGLPMDPNLVGDERFPVSARAAFEGSSVYAAGRLLLAANERHLGERFLVHLSESLSRTEQGALADLALEWNEPHVALMIAKEAARQGRTIEKAYYPVTSLAKRNLPVPVELTLSIARRESEFDPTVVSHAGARGLMQLMPGTAQHVTKRLSMPYQLARLTSDPEYNATLGSAYLAELIEEFGDNFVLVSAAYNAGPGRPRRWIQEYGDPRSPQVDPVDWIEHIPFRETQNYVMRVMESLPVYRARLAGKTLPLRLSAELKGEAGGVQSPILPAAVRVDTSRPRAGGILSSPRPTPRPGAELAPERPPEREAALPSLGEGMFSSPRPAARATR